ncbi:MAG: DUF6273 domain-containing protein [Butyrivibrio sp.]|nr:DUF6273 domain-containing protein [Butyrivibrio sp.]
MRKKKIIIAAILIAVISITLVDIALSVWYNREEEHTTLENIAYDKSKRMTVVYIKEDNEYAPYMVLESNYGGNVLLLRQYLLPEEMPYKPSKHPSEHSALSGGWAYYEYGSYYEESSIDEFLNTDFLNVFSPNVQEAIVDSAIEVTDKASYSGPNRASVTHRIDRKIFLLSSVELGDYFSVGHCMTKEGTALKYFEDASHSVRRACKASGEGWPYWTRTPWIWETCEVNVIGVEKTSSAPADKLLGVRPAFCLGKDTTVHKDSSIIEGQSVYVLDLESE